MLDPSLTRLAVTGVVILIFVLAYPSQYFLLAEHWSRDQIIFFNVLVACIWVTYYRSIFTDPGQPPESWAPIAAGNGGGVDAEEGRGRGEERRLVAVAGRWCKRCERFKPARCHHCKTCKKCVLKMDHHCPWTANCVGYRNFPHFIRFLFYTSATTSYLMLHLLFRAYAVFLDRDLPAYHSPHSLTELVFLVFLILLNAPVSLALTVLFLRTIFSAAGGETTIESWEKERHDALVRRRVVRRQVFPYDVGLWENMVCAFGYQFNPILWFNPLARSPVVGKMLSTVPGVPGGMKAGLEWEVNGFEDPDAIWPPADPERDPIPQGASGGMRDSGDFSIREDLGDMEAFRRRQRADLQRWNKNRGGAYASGSAGGYGGSNLETSWVGVQHPEEYDYDNPTWSGYEIDEEYLPENNTPEREAAEGTFQRGRAWRNDEGETLADYGVDEDLEDEDEDIPLALLRQRRREEAERTGGVLKPISGN